ncbi:MAG: hypothetical protein UT28_C0001G0634 [Berkelbacteria bacterium GW2011_GWE1_39_12]|uniref:Uncharacterized protein n=1 Tax=Berkelbacteria bacterium GW2011_GWE1_39_12 TaxID=1618337 RepID=A0A0G4B3L0_9BACT|nr:MAG: hypothetical protein UT28_C0001G0634 [Berkelbacteria bacterium GW2011_GWE1_39_12]
MFYVPKQEVKPEVRQELNPIYRFTNRDTVRDLTMVDITLIFLRILNVKSPLHFVKYFLDKLGELRYILLFYAESDIEHLSMGQFAQTKLISKWRDPMFSILEVIRVLTVLVCILVLYKGASCGRQGMAVFGTFSSMAFAELGFRIVMIGNGLPGLDVLDGMFVGIGFFLSIALWISFVPDKASDKGDDCIVIGFVQRFGHTVFYEGSAEPFNNWWNRTFGLSNFVSGLEIKNCRFAYGNGPSFNGRYVIKAQRSIAYKEFLELKRTIPRDLDKLVQELIFEKAPADVVISKLAAFWKSHKGFELQKFDLFPHQPQNLMAPIRKKAEV